MASVDLGAIEFGKLELNPPMTTVRLIDGPCAGTWAEAPEFRELWQRIGRKGVEAQMWARYDPASRCEYTYSGVTITTEQLRDALYELECDGHTYGESYGV
jgi:hypothetical protein